MRKNFSRKKKKKGTVKEKYLVSGVAGGSSQAQKGQEPMETAELASSHAHSPKLHHIPI